MDRISQFGRNDWRVVPFGLMLGFLLHMGWEWFLGHEFSLDQNSKLLLLVGVLLTFLQCGRGLPRIDGVSGLAAAIVMMVHLLAAGGFEMPAVMLFLLAVSAIGVSDAESLTSINGLRSNVAPQARRRQWALLPAAGMCAAMATVVLQFGLIPVLSSERHMRVADFDLRHVQNFRAAADGYRKAAESDPLGTVARQRLAELETYRLSEFESRQEGENQQLDGPVSFEISDSFPVEKRISDALAACDLLIAADRRNSLSLRTQASCLATGGRILKNPEMVCQAVRVQQQVVALHPSSIESWYELVELCEEPLADCGQPLSQQAAQRVLELDRINRQWGHQDRYLLVEQLDLLNRIVEK